jgi:hypothetical protein
LRGVIAPSRDRLIVLGRYLLAILSGNLLWEVAQLPLYTIWRESVPSQIAFAVLHCTVGDLLIATSALLGALVLVGNGRWPHRRFGGVGATAVAAGVFYTIFSEWLNTEIRGSWAYTAGMPRLPLIGTGLAPFAQWLVVPTLALMWARRGAQPAGGAPTAKAPS